MMSLASLLLPHELTNDEDVKRDQMYLMQRYLGAASEREQEQKREERERDSPTYERESATTRYRRSFQQLLDDLDWRITYEASCITWPGTCCGAFLQEDLSEWRVVRSDDFDEVRAGDLSLSGIGEGDWLGGPGRGAGSSLGRGFLRERLLHGTQSMRVRELDLGVHGALPRGAIHRVIRQSWGQLGACYAEGLARNPNLEGRVSVRFVIGRDGSVRKAENAGSDLPDDEAVECVVGAYSGLSFPQPERGTVTVSSRIGFAPG
jgi:hypothetical protein